MRPGDLLEQRYRLVRVLGRGRSGTVWCARNELIDRAVAVKVLHRSLATDPERLQRFFQEARACGRVRHPSVVEVLDLGQGDDGVLFLVMELLEGETMASLLGRKGRLSVDEALALVIPLAHGLAAAHAHGILHRDLKPANIYLHKTPTGGLQPKILDFGISKIIGNDVTATGVVLGTPSYMSPEQARGVPDLDPRTDVWSLGVILYELLAGRLPFIAKEYRALVDEILERKHTPVDQISNEVPREVAQLVNETLEKSRDRRLPSAAAMAQRLTSVLRARGKSDMLRDPEDEFSEGAPTLAQDRDKVLPKGSLAQPQAPVIADVGDDTVGDANPLPVVHAPQPAVPSNTRAGVGPSQPAREPQIPKGGPSPFTALLAAQTSGAKRIENTPLPRPAAGAPARPSRSPADTSTAMRVAVSGSTPSDPPGRNPEETKPDPLPLARKVEGARPEPAARPATTQSWELSVGLAASGRAEVLLGASEAAPMRVNEDWDTTVADVSATALEKGPLPKAAPAPPMVTDYPPAASPKKPTTRPLIDNKPARRDDSVVPTIGAIPGFTAAAPKTPIASSVAPPNTTLPSGAVTGGPRKSTPPPPPVRKAISTPPPPAVAADSPKRPPKPPPKTVPPTNGSLHKPTLRPPAEGFAVPGPTPSQLPRDAQTSSRRASVPPPANAQLIAPELYALGDDRVDAQPFELTQQANANGHESPPEMAVASTRDATALSTSIPADSNIETDRHRAAGPSIVPLMVAAVAILFFFGALLGTVAASSRSSEQHVRHLATTTGVLVAWYSQKAIEDEESAKAEETKAAEESKKKEDEKAAAAKKEADDKAAADKAAADAAAAASASAAAAASESAKPKAAAPKWTPPPKSTTPKKTTSVAPTKKTADPPPKKQSSDKDWWKKKF
jgi:serine/threonine-protein kinase